MKKKKEKQCKKKCSLLFAISGSDFFTSHNISSITIMIIITTCELNERDREKFILFHYFVDNFFVVARWREKERGKGRRFCKGKSLIDMIFTGCSEKKDVKSQTSLLLINYINKKSSHSLLSSLTIFRFFFSSSSLRCMKWANMISINFYPRRKRKYSLIEHLKSDKQAIIGVFTLSHKKITFLDRKLVGHLQTLFPLLNKVAKRW